MQRCSERGKLLRLFGLLWFVLGGTAAVVTAVVALVTGSVGPLVGTAVGGGIAVVAAAVWWAGWARKRAGLRIFRLGLEARGEVVGVREDRAVRVNGRYPWRVDYTFLTKTGGAARATETYWGQRPAFKVGQSVVVLYEPDQPGHSALWSTPGEITT